MLCEKEGDKGPFCLTYNLRNIRQIILDEYTRNFFKTKREVYIEKQFVNLICAIFNSNMKDNLKISHFQLKFEPQELTEQNISSKESSKKENSFQIHIEKDYTIIKIIDFKSNFNVDNFKQGLYDATDNQKGIIIDLRDNTGGKIKKLMYLLSYFFNDKTTLIYSLYRKHEPFFWIYFTLQ